MRTLEFTLPEVVVESLPERRSTTCCGILPPHERRLRNRLAALED